MINNVNQRHGVSDDLLRTKLEKSSIDMSSILGSIGSLENVAALTDIFKQTKRTDNLSVNDQSTASKRYVHSVYSIDSVDTMYNVKKLRM